MAHTCNSSTLEAEAEKIAIQGQPGLTEPDRLKNK
jgi:hypothetical protein